MRELTEPIPENAPMSIEVAVLVHSLASGGAQNNAINLVAGLREIGHKAGIVLVYREGELLDSEAVDLSQTNVLSRRSAASIGRIYTAWQVVSGLRALGSRTIILNSWPSAEIVLLAKRLRILHARLIYVFHSSPGEALQSRLASRALRFAWVRIMRFLLRGANYCVAVSEGVAKDAARIFAIDSTKVRVVRPGIDPKWLSVGRHSGLHGVLDAARRPLLLSVGRLVPAKNHALLLRAFARQEPSTRGTLVIAGDGPLKADLFSLAIDLDVSQDVRILGYVGNVIDFVESADAVIMSSAWEGFPLALAEAASAGRTVVATDCPSGPAEIAELFADRFTLVPNFDEDALAAAICRITEAFTDGKDLMFSPLIPQKLSLSYQAQEYAELFNQ